jgi:hypothetical protein
VQEHGVTELYIDRGDATENKKIFDTLLAQKEQIEKAFGGSLEWERLDAKRACRIKNVVTLGGYRSPDQEWPAIQSAMVDSMSKLESALLPSIENLDL